MGPARLKVTTLSAGTVISLLPVKAAARGSSTGSQQATDQCSLAAAGETADQRAAASAATNKSCGPFALAFGCRFIGISCDFVVAYPADRDAQVSSALEPALTLGGNHCPADRGTCAG